MLGGTAAMMETATISRGNMFTSYRLRLGWYTSSTCEHAQGLQQLYHAPHKPSVHTLAALQHTGGWHSCVRWLCLLLPVVQQVQETGLHHCSLALHCRLHSLHSAEVRVWGSVGLVVGPVNPANTQGALQLRKAVKVAMSCRHRAQVCRHAQQ